MKPKVVKNIKPKVSKKNIKRVSKVAKNINKNVASLQDAVKEIRKATTELQDAMRRLDSLAPIVQSEKTEKKGEQAA